MNKKYIFFPIFFLTLLLFSSCSRDSSFLVFDFNSCVEDGNLVMESYPRQCRSKDGNLFVENIANVLEKTDLIQVENVYPNKIISSPLELRGIARGFWYFEADFPVKIIDNRGNLIVQSFAKTDDDWMTDQFVSFYSVLEFNEQPSGSYGAIILEKDNPSGMAEHSDFLEIPIIFK